MSLILRLSLALALLAVLSIHAFAAVPTDPCPRPATGSLVQPPPELFSQNGTLNVAFDYYTTVDSDGRSLFCFVTPDGLQSPTLHVKPGDSLNVTVTNMVPAPPAGSPTEGVPSKPCGDTTMTMTAVNMHFHGTNTSPACHGDQVIHTLVNSGESFQYSLQFPANEPPGLYWYHPHVHGVAEAAVQGGASGAIIVDGIQNAQPAVAGLPERVLVVRDQTIAGNPARGSPGPALDLTLNYVPIAYPALTPAIMEMVSGQSELWRVANASADTVLDLQLQYDGVAQPLQLAGLDGVPTGSQDGLGAGKLVTQTDILLAPAARAEFIVAAPSAQVQNASFVTLKADTGFFGDSDPLRTLATIQTKPGPSPLPIIPPVSGAPGPQRFAGLASATPIAQRKLYFSVALSDPSNPASLPNFFITVDGATPTLFDPNNPPAITTTQGAVEDWTIENRDMGVHAFHQHQIHFLLLAENGVPVPADQSQFLDTVVVPAWSGTGPYPSVTLRMDFRGMDVGDFVYHCHILEHEDLGMMAIIRVLPSFQRVQPKS
jgi:FtsP/CotA-like multicopper oxidase with cupredoxin domain